MFNVVRRKNRPGRISTGWIAKLCCESSQDNGGFMSFGHHFFDEPQRHKMPQMQARKRGINPKFHSFAWGDISVFWKDLKIHDSSCGSPQGTIINPQSPVLVG